jgi:hypothetical protein
LATHTFAEQTVPALLHGASGPAQHAWPVAPHTVVMSGPLMAMSPPLPPLPPLPPAPPPPLMSSSPTPPARSGEKPFL